MDVWVIVYAIGAAQAVLLAFALWWRRANPQANRMLAAWLAIVGVDLAIKSLHLAAPGPGTLVAFRMVALFPFLYGSAFYLYVRALTTGRGFALRDTVHLAGYALVLGMTAPLLLVDPEHTTALFAHWSADDWPPRWFDPFLFAYSLSYVVAALVRVQRYRRRLRQQRSDADRMTLRWIDALSVGQILIWCVAAVTTTTTAIPGVDYHLIYGAVAAWVCVVGWFSLSQPPVARESPPADDVEVAGTGTQTARDDDSRFPAVEARLSQLMAQDLLYREPALTMGQLARRSGYPEYLVSAVINRRLGGNFWEYINRYRIDAAAACLSDRDDGRTILDIAYACGFTSKSTFNAAFKRQMGQTPSAYRRRHVQPSAVASARR